MELLLYSLRLVVQTLVVGCFFVAPVIVAAASPSSQIAQFGRLAVVNGILIVWLTIPWIVSAIRVFRTVRDFGVWYRTYEAADYVISAHMLRRQALDKSSSAPPAMWLERKIAALREWRQKIERHCRLREGETRWADVTLHAVQLS